MVLYGVARQCDTQLISKCVRGPSKEPCTVGRVHGWEQIVLQEPDLMAADSREMHSPPMNEGVPRATGATPAAVRCLSGRYARGTEQFCVPEFGEPAGSHKTMKERRALRWTFNQPV